MTVPELGSGDNRLGKRGEGAKVRDLFGKGNVKSSLSGDKGEVSARLFAGEIAGF